MIGRGWICMGGEVGWIWEKLRREVEGEERVGKKEN